MDNNPKNLASQFRPAVPAQPGQPFMQSAAGAQQYSPMGQPQMPQFSQPMQQRPGQPGHLSSSSQPPMSYMQPPQFQNSANTNSHVPSLSGPSYTRADASTVWKEFTTAEGKKYYYNKDTKQSKWTIPDELKLARELAEKEASRGTRSPATLTPSTLDQLSASISSANDVSSSPVAVTPVIPVANVVAESSSLIPVAVTPVFSANMHSSPMAKTDNASLQGSPKALDGVSARDTEMATERQRAMRENKRGRGSSSHDASSRQPRAPEPVIRFLEDVDPRYQPKVRLELLRRKTVGYDYSFDNL